MTHGSDQITGLPPAPTRRFVEVIALVSMVVAGLVAAIDAATIPTRSSGGVVPDRDIWLFAFAVSMITVVACLEVVRIRDDPRIRGLAAAAALLNLAVPVLALLAGATSWFLVAAYSVTALLLGVVASGVPLRLPRAALRPVPFPHRPRRHHGPRRHPKLAA